MLRAGPGFVNRLVPPRMPCYAPEAAGMGKTTGWRKVATSTWGWPTDPQVYGKLEFDGTPVLEAIQVLRERSGARVTTTHLVTRALAISLRDNPAINTRLRFGRFIPRETVDVFVIVAAGGGGDLSGVTIRQADEKSAAELARELDERAARARAGEGELDRAKGMMAATPYLLLRPFLRLSAFLTSDMNRNLRRLGMPRQAFGGAMVTNVGVFGIQEGWAPLSPIYRVPVLVLAGEITTRPWVVDGIVEPRPVLPVTATIDHRWVDGYEITGLIESFQKYLANPLAQES
jgi:pyruvate/2-oxoglutarate dehydrogenase complex dihydrolipoamide acyltransferase (E2) component